MLPPVQTRRPAARSMAATREVVVVLPALPVMPMTCAGQRSRNSWASLASGMPRSRAARTMGAVSGTPPERQTRSVVSSSCRGWSPLTNSTAAPGGNSSMAGWMTAWSLTTTRAPRVGSQRVSARPCRP